jgi:hypothetical protein
MSMGGVLWVIMVLTMMKDRFLLVEGVGFWLLPLQSCMVFILHADILSLAFVFNSLLDNLPPG